MLTTSVLLALLACGGSPSEPLAPNAEPPAATEPAAAASTPPPTGGARSSQLDPARACDRSACGKVTDEAGQPIAGATLDVARNDAVKEPPEIIDPTGGWLFHIREENSGPPPWKLVFAAPGYVSQTHPVPDPIPETGFKIDVKLVKEAK